MAGSSALEYLIWY